MGSKYNKKLGMFIRQIDVRNNSAQLGEENLYGISVTKEFIVSHANLVGVTFDNYKVVATRQFAYIPDTSRRGDKIAISLNQFKEDIIVSSICSVFEIIDEEQLLPEYLLLWFMRPEFDRYARFMSNGSAREVFDWECMCGVELPVPPIEEQKRIVHCYQVITERIQLLQSLNSKLDDMMKAIYRHMFSSDYEISDENDALATLCLDIQRGYTPIYSSNSTIYDLNQKVNKGLYLDKQFFAMIDENANIPIEKFARKQDILINYLGDGTLGRVHYYNEITTNVVVNQFIIIIRTNPDLLLPEYLYSLLSSPEYQRIIQGSVSGSTGMLVLNISTIRDFKIPLPPLALQKVYAEKVDPIWECITTNYLEISNLEKLARCIISGI